MKFNIIKDKDGNDIGLKSYESCVYDSKGRALPDKISDINTRITTLNSEIMKINDRFKDLTEKIPAFGVIKRSDPNTNICLLRDNNGVITSDYGFTYEKLSGILQSGKYHDYIKDGDYIELTASNGDYFEMYANVDTYYGFGPEGQKIGHHIDFISKDLIPGSCGDVNLPSTERDMFYYNKDYTYSTNGNNNGVSTEYSPFLSNSSEHRSSTSGVMIDMLNDYYTSYIPSSIKSHIIKKYHKVPYRYSSSSSTLLSDDNGSEWRELPYLWFPYEREVYGHNQLGTKTYENWMKWYYVFSNIEGFTFKYDYERRPESASPWWLATAVSSNATSSGYHEANSKVSFCRVTGNGGLITCAQSNESYGAPLCFRFQ